jgi:RHS repeat-associated protein
VGPDSCGGRDRAETTTYVYDGDGDVTQETDPDGRVTTYAYNNLGQETQEQWFDSAADQAEGVSTDTLNYTYDNIGDLLTAGDDISSDTFSYNVLGQQTAVTSTGVLGAPSVTLASGYDANGDRTALDATIGAAADFQNSYTYDAFGDETSVTQQGGSAGDAVAAKNVIFGYNDDSELTSINRYANTSTSDLVATSAYGYDNDGNLTSLTDAQGSTTFAGYTWTYDAGGLVQTFANSQHTDEDLTYSYDHDNELTGATYTSGGASEESYSYDANGNRTSTGGTSTTLGADDEVTAEAGYTYQSDAAGNVIEATDTSTGAYTIYTYDNRNRLTSATIYGNGGDTPTQTVTYTYDIFNNLIGRSVTQDGTTTNQSFVFDDPAQNGQVVLAFASTGTSPTSAQLTDRFLWGPAVDQLLADETNIPSLTSPGTVDWTLGDNENTIRDVAQYNASTGVTSVVDHIDYNAFGQQLGQTNAAAGIIFGYTGEYEDSATGLQRNGDRWYNSFTATWMSQDPIGFAGGQANLSEYVGDDPTTWADPEGLVKTKNWRKCLLRASQ